MKVVFIEDVPNVGEVGEVKDVADGYGRNYLIPKKLAVLPGSQASSIVKAQLKVKARRQAETEAEMAKLGKQLEGKEVTVKARVGASDRLYGSITSADIAEELDRSEGLVIDKRKIEIEEPIRQLGNYEVTIRLTKDVMPKIKLIVLGEEEKEEEEGGEKEEVAVKKVKAEKKKKPTDEEKPEEEKSTDEAKAEKPADEVKPKKASKPKAAIEKKAEAKKKIQAKKKVKTEEEQKPADEEKAEEEKPADEVKIEMEEQKTVEEGKEEA